VDLNLLVQTGAEIAAKALFLNALEKAVFGWLGLSDLVGNGVYALFKLPLIDMGLGFNYATASKGFGIRNNANYLNNYLPYAIAWSYAFGSAVITNLVQTTVNSLVFGPPAQIVMDSIEPMYNYYFPETQSGTSKEEL
jgi:hypothetical protein